MSISTSFAALAIYATEGNRVSADNKEGKESMGLISRVKATASALMMMKEKENDQCWPTLPKHDRKMQPSLPFFAPEFDGLHCFETLIPN
ncbi:hypothetical protein F0562_022589 [Nyssa sinensis]|uniref:Uncharacterized protein n=1 Tax=Nyssa sinensis TaxID=561372 RepID=A0A5J5BS52_9ASTE|nr:hypothetical protein F0562_022589 [Nyssa sinensis]